MEGIEVAPRLSLNDAFAFVLAENNPGRTLLTGDASLRTLAETREMEVQGVLWVIDRFREHEIEKVLALHRALCSMRDDTAVRLPGRALQTAIRLHGKPSSKA